MTPAEAAEAKAAFEALPREIQLELLKEYYEQQMAIYDGLPKWMRDKIKENGT